MIASITVNEICHRYSLLCFAGPNTSTDDAWQFSVPDAKYHSDSSTHHRHDSYSDAGNQKERGTDVPFLTSSATPSNLLLHPTFCLNVSVVAATGVAVAGFLVAGTMPRTGVCCFIARRVRCVADGRKGQRDICSLLKDYGLGVPS